MGLFSRRKDEPAFEPDPEAGASEEGTAEGGADVEDDGRPERPDTMPIGEDDRARIDAALARFAEVGGDVDDLASIGALYDRAITGGDGLGPEEAAQVIGLVVGEHLVRHGRMDWRIVNDAFGSDLGVSARRRDRSVIPSTVVATRWINREQGWIPGAIGHLVRLGNG